MEKRVSLSLYNTLSTSIAALHRFTEDSKAAKRWDDATLECIATEAGEISGIAKLFLRRRKVVPMREVA